MKIKKGTSFFVAVALIAIGALLLLESWNILRHSRQWWLPIILIGLGILVIMTSKGVVNILGWVLAVYGALLFLMAAGILNLPFLNELQPGIWILFGLILLL